MKRTATRLLLFLLVAALVAAFLGTLAVLVLPRALPALPGPPADLADLLFYGVAALGIVGAGFVAFSRNVVWSCMGLLLALLGVGGIYLFLSADFLAVAQLLVYIGGVLVLVLFAVMLTSRIGDVNVSNLSFGPVGGIALFAAVTPVLIAVAVLVPWPRRPPPPMGPTTAAIGNEFLSRWLLPFEVSSVVLLATLVGAVVMARKELKAEEPGGVP